MVESISKVAIIGGGPSGLATLHELLHTTEESTSTITKPSAPTLPLKSAFKEIVVFEQTDHIAGVWNYSAETDPQFPQTENYSDPNSIRGFRTPNDEQFNNKWDKSAVYDHLFTNIPNDLMRFSTSLETPQLVDKNSNIYAPFVLHQNVLNYVHRFAEERDLKKYIRFNSCVEKVYKKDNHWILSICKTTPHGEEWYEEEFDAVAVCVGRFNVPFMPFVNGMKQYVDKNPGKVMHSKAFRNTENLKDKKVLIVGSGISAIDILQYLFPICKEVHISGNSVNSFGKNNASEEERKKLADWVERILSDSSLPLFKHSRIKEFKDEIVSFEDGSSDNFDVIIFCTGYHLYYPFLEIPENKEKGYVSITSGVDGNPNYARTKVDNLYLYTFTTADPTLAHVGVAQNPLFFLTSETNAIAIAGVWSRWNKDSKLPTFEEMNKWCKNRFIGKKSGFQVYDENSIHDLIKASLELGPENRFNFLPYLTPKTVTESKKVLEDLFYKFAKGELDQFDKKCQYSG
ncbi:hypothetical protein DAMA08_035080 [Martiniozyma asiatica (nom. inval.)]|nr:hypothetical protein DAMA08_035080 [Martiniozyma asiatica]